MKDLLSQLIIFSDIKNDEILNKVSGITDEASINEAVSLLLGKADTFGFEGNLWKDYIAYLLVYSENFYTLSCEGRGRQKGSIDTLALSEMKIIKQLFDYDFSALERELSVSSFTFISDFTADSLKAELRSNTPGQRIMRLAESLSDQSEEVMLDTLCDFYKNYGVGDFGLGRAFRISDDGNDVSFIPISETDDIRLSHIVGYEVQKRKLVENTEAFISGRPANNCLLFGDAGTGKSSSVKALINEYYDDGLRMIELYKHEMKSLAKVISIIRNRNYKFIIYMDDLSFEDFEVEYEYLKAVIEGGLEKRASNVLIYATSNRRNIIKETWKDLDDLDMDKHSSDTMQEKLSLVSRFGITISYMNPNKKLYEEIVLSIAERYPEIDMDREELLEEANKWEIAHGGFSGRTARQFVDHVLGMQPELE